MYACLWLYEYGNVLIQIILVKVSWAAGQISFSQEEETITNQELTQLTVGAKSISDVNVITSDL